MYSDMTGVILAGGKSQRMGTNKALLKMGSYTVIEKTANLVKELFANVILISNEPELYRFLNLPTYKDIYKHQGPLAGIHSGLVHSQTIKNFVISCDVPLMKKEVIEFICNYQSTATVVIPRAQGYLQQLCGIYSKTLLPQIESILLQPLAPSPVIKTAEQPSHHEKPHKHCGHHHDQIKRTCAVLFLIQSVSTTVIELEKQMHNFNPDCFLNMNHPEDYEKCLSREFLTSFGTNMTLEKQE